MTIPRPTILSAYIADMIADAENGVTRDYGNDLLQIRFAILHMECDLARLHCDAADRVVAAQEQRTWRNAAIAASDNVVDIEPWRARQALVATGMKAWF